MEDMNDVPPEVIAAGVVAMKQVVYATEGDAVAAIFKAMVIEARKLSGYRRDVEPYTDAEVAHMTGGA